MSVNAGSSDTYWGLTPRSDDGDEETKEEKDTLLAAALSQNPFKKLYDNRVLYLRGPIEDTKADEIVAQLLALGSDSDDDITMYINSPGGVISGMFAMYDVMHLINAKVNTVCVGMAASAGAFLLATGTGLAPFLSLIKDPESYERFDKVVVVHGVRYENDLAYRHVLEHELKEHEYLGDLVGGQLIYYPTVTREDFRNQGRITDLIRSNKLTDDLGLEPMNSTDDRAMLCGSPAMLKDTASLLDERGFTISAGIGEPGDYVIERAFVEK